MATISVIIPAYNAERTIIKTIESVQKQTFQDLEIIVINDGSRDLTLELLETIPEPRLKVYSYPNGGVSIARNHGISNATGNYFSFIDADDLWTEDKLEKQLLALQQNPEAGVAYSWTFYMIESSENSNNICFISDEKVAFTGNIYSKLLLKNFIGNGSNILARREAIESVGEFEPSLKFCEDWDYYLRLAAKWDFVLVREPQILYRKTVGTATCQASIMEEGGLYVINKTYQTVPSQLLHLKKRTLANFYCYCGGLYFNNGYQPEDITKAKKRFWLAVKFYPGILFRQETQVLLLKLLIPRNLISYVVPKLKKLFVVRDPRN
jgi:glycosyltransferase involved in cell wall biosynthesis